MWKSPASFPSQLPSSYSSVPILTNGRRIPYICQLKVIQCLQSETDFGVNSTSIKNEKLLQCGSPLSGDLSSSSPSGSS